MSAERVQDNMQNRLAVFKFNGNFRHTRGSRMKSRYKSLHGLFLLLDMCARINKVGKKNEVLGLGPSLSMQRVPKLTWLKETVLARVA